MRRWDDSSTVLLELEWGASVFLL
uniref:Uncharacterized protein n=1 Tax=Nelumbo nucifera TaxID=4432 RepID=A0A822ZQ83_NELNU|nr:TPA_asm: hypothetical protein HUJ06_003739 [Nelumbo nucifera]